MKTSDASDGESISEIADMLSVSPQYAGKQKRTCLEILKESYRQFLEANTPFSILIFTFISTYFLTNFCLAPALLKKIVAFFGF